MNHYIQYINSIALQNKYTKYYSDIILNAIARGNNRKELEPKFGYIEQHHILPKSFKLGGEKDSENLVFLTAKEHFIVHLCATKMFEGILKSKMVFAFRQMTVRNKYQTARITSRLYEKIKPNYKNFIRLYKETTVKYIYDSEKEEINKLKNLGWSEKVTPEFKEKNIKGMKGKTHTQETKNKMSESYRRRTQVLYNPKQEKQPKNKKSMSGKNNPMYGKKHSERTLKLISKNIKNAHEKRKLDNPEKYKTEILNRSILSKKMHSDENFKQKSKIFNSKAQKNHNMSPQEYYDLKLKPLLYLGFLPTSIVRYKLLDMCAGSISRLIKNFGTPEDKEQFMLNKLNSKGANKKYKNFLEKQYTQLCNN